MAEIEIGGRTLLIDDGDLHLLDGYRWYASRSGALGRPVRSVRSSKGGYIERPLVRDLLPNLGRGQQVRYRNGNAFDLRRENLIAPEAPPAAATPLARGAVAELAVAADLFRHGLEVFTPIHGYSRYDMIAADSANRLYRVQVKSGCSKAGSLVVSLKSVSATSSGNTIRPLDLTTLDLLAVYDTTTRQVAYLSPLSLRSRTSLSLWAQDETSANAKRRDGGRTRRRLLIQDLSSPWQALPE